MVDKKGKIMASQKKWAKPAPENNLDLFQEAVSSNKRTISIEPKGSALSLGVTPQENSEPIYWNWLYEHEIAYDFRREMAFETKIKTETPLSNAVDLICSHFLGRVVYRSNK